MDGPEDKMKKIYGILNKALIMAPLVIGGCAAKHVKTPDYKTESTVDRIGFLRDIQTIHENAPQGGVFDCGVSLFFTTSQGVDVDIYVRPIHDENVPYSVMADGNDALRALK